MWRSLCSEALAARSKLAIPSASKLLALRGTNRIPLGDALSNPSGRFKLVAVESFPQYHATGYTLEHGPTGTRYLHIDTADTNNAFMVGFATPPADSSGVAHILEHTVLCGSHRFPVRDPFFAMLRRSLSTFMNAMTASDHTMYPFATRNAQDYYNLLAVYLDATFFPKLRKLDFLQEGHRLEFDEKGKLVFKGVVYNEMKGAMSDSASIFYQEMQSALYPDTIYRYNSGGEPQDIPNLTYDYLKQFHAEHYHPSNAVFYSYGDIPPPLEFLDEFVLKYFEDKKSVEISKSRKNAIQHQPRFDAARKMEIRCPESPILADENKQTTFALGFLCNESYKHDLEETIGMKMLSLLLLDGPLSPMYQSLVKANIGSGYAPGTGYNSSYKDSMFVIGLENIKDEDRTLVEKEIFKALEECANRGFEMKRIDSVVHQVELDAKRVKPKFGLGVGYRAVENWLLDSDPFLSFRIPDIVSKIEAKVKIGEPFFQNLIKKYFLENGHRVDLAMVPDPEYLGHRSQREQFLLNSLFGKLEARDKERIVKEATELEEDQIKVANSDFNCLPSLTKSDIWTRGEIDLDYSFKITNVMGKEVQVAEHITNGILYTKALVDVSKLLPLLTEDEKQVLPLFAALITEVGAGKRTYLEMADEIEAKTGGFSSSLSCDSNPSDLSKVDQHFTLSSHSLQRNFLSLVELMHDMLYQPNFSEDEEHIKTNLLAYCSHLSNSLQDSGHRFALSYAAAQTGIASAVRSEELGGIAYVELLNQIVSNEQGKSIAWVIQNLTSISSKLSKSVGVERYALTGDSHGLQSCSEMFERSRLFDQVQPASFPLKSTSTLNNLDSTFKGSKQTFIGLPIQVNHAAMCIPTVPCTHPDSSKLRLLGSLMSSFYLHREVREKGGAYGSGARQSSDGLFSFFSFRDPNCEKTIDVFKESCKWASGKTESTFSDQDIQESTLKLFSSIDSPSSPGQRGMGYFKSRISKEFALEERHRLLSITRDDLVDVANRYLVQAIDSEKSRVAVVGRKDSAPKSSSSWEFKSLGKSR